MNWGTVELPRIDTGSFTFGKKKKVELNLELLPWLESVTPTWKWRWNYLDLIQQNLNKITSGEIKKLMLFLPPRHGKSEMVTVRYPVYRLEKTPTTRIVVAAYSQVLANKFSRKSRRIAQSRMTLSRERSAVEDWETLEGGNYRAIGVGGGITGQGGDLIIIDDPVKSREEANSQAYRDRVYDWYTDDLYTRLEPGAAMTLIMTRWHEDDLAGRILASEDGPNWTVIKLPALAEENDPLGRSVGQALCPERYNEDALNKISKILLRSWWALYQQRPQEQEGDFFKASWFEIVDALPVGCTFVRYWDKAGSKDEGDFTAGVLIAKAPDGIYYIVDVVRGQWKSGEREKVIKQTAQLDKTAYSNVTIWYEIEGGSGGKESGEHTQTNLDGFSAHGEHPTGEKTARAEPLQSEAEVGNVRMLRGLWNAAYIAELTSFPNGAHDDQVDGSSGAFNKLSGTSGWTQWAKKKTEEIIKQQAEALANGA